VQTTELDSTIRRPPGAVIALPSSPGRSTRNSLGDWYGSEYIVR
jgi:hypothetical protein